MQYSSQISLVLHLKNIHFILLFVHIHTITNRSRVIIHKFLIIFEIKLIISLFNGHIKKIIHYIHLIISEKT